MGDSGIKFVSLLLLQHSSCSTLVSTLASTLVLINPIHSFLFLTDRSQWGKRRKLQVDVSVRANAIKVSSRDTSLDW